MQPSALCAPAGSSPNRWETLCALQGLLPLLKKAAADIDRPDMVYWFAQADAGLAKSSGAGHPMPRRSPP